MTRRDFLKALGWTAGCVTFAPTVLEAKGWMAPDAVDDLPIFVGDVVTLEGCYTLNPVTKLPTVHRQMFVITDVCEAGVRLHPRPRNWSTDWIPADKTRPVWARGVVDAYQDRGGLDRAQDRETGREASG